MITGKITRSGQITIPKSLRSDIYQIGSIVEFIPDGENLIIKPLKKTAKKPESITKILEVLQRPIMGEFTQMSEDEVIKTVNKEISKYRSGK